VLLLNYKDTSKDTTLFEVSFAARKLMNLIFNEAILEMAQGSFLIPKEPFSLTIMYEIGKLKVLKTLQIERKFKDTFY